MTTVRCPMRECRKAIDLEALPHAARGGAPARPERPPCLHFIAAWGGQRGPMVEAVLYALEGNRELVIRNIRPPEVQASILDAERAGLEEDVRRFVHVVEDAAAFGDQFEANSVSRAFAQRILGPDPIATMSRRDR